MYFTLNPSTCIDVCHLPLLTYAHFVFQSSAFCIYNEAENHISAYASTNPASEGLFRQLLTLGKYANTSIQISKLQEALPREPLLKSRQSTVDLLELTSSD